MNIDPQNNASHILSQNIAKSGQQAPAKSESNANNSVNNAGDKLELNTLDSLRSIPEVRPEMVAKGKELLNDPNFPSQEMINQMAKLIVPFADEQ